MGLNRKKFQELLGPAYKFSIKKVSFQDLARDDAYFMHVTEIGTGVRIFTDVVYEGDLIKHKKAYDALNWIKDTKPMFKGLRVCVG